MFFYYVPNLRFKEFTNLWKQISFENLAFYKKGPFGSALTKDIFVPKSEDTIKVYEQQNAIYKDWKLSRYYITNEYYKKMKSFTVYCGDIIVSCAGTIGELYVIPNDAEIGIINQALMIIRTSEIVNQKFYIYLFNIMIKSFSEKYGNGSAIHNIPPFNDLKKHLVFIPSINEQVKISTFLTKIDERIETQNKIIKDLETLKKWIINQNFSNKPNMNVGSFIEQTSEKNKQNIVNRILSVNNKFGFVNQNEQFEDRIVASDDKSKYKIVRKNHFAFNPARINVGSIAKLETYDIGIVSPMYICFKCNNVNIDVDYLAYYFFSNKFKNEMNKKLEGSVRQCLQYDSLCKIKFYIPSLKEQQNFVKKVKTLTSKLNKEKDILLLYKKQKAYLLQNMFI